MCVTKRESAFLAWELQSKLQEQRNGGGGGGGEGGQGGGGAGGLSSLVLPNAIL